MSHASSSPHIQPLPRNGQEPGGLRIKIGGVTRPADAQLAGELGAWAVSVELAPRGPRFVSGEQARAIFAAMPPGVLRVGVFRNQSPQVVTLAAEHLGLDLVELAGHETDEVVQAVGPQRVIKTVVLHELVGVATVLGYSAAYLQVNKAALGSSGGGGGGIRDEVDLALAAELAQRFPRTLIGGAINPAALPQAVRTVRPWGIDAASGVEIEAEPGVKDAGLLRALFAAAATATA